MATDPHQWEIIGDIVFTRTREGVIPDETWARFLADIKKGARIVFAVSEGDPAPSPTQRRDAAKALTDHGVTAIVITESRISRGILTAMSWFGANVKAYSWTELDKAIEHASSSAPVQKEIRARADAFRKQGPLS
jgi:predicted Fe-Mo cluster-binding NifX family protein